MERNQLVRSILLTIIFLFAFLTALPADASPGATRMARQGIDNLMRLDFDAAERAFERLESKYPDYPLHALLKASFYWVKAEASQGEERKPAWNEASAQLSKAMEISEKGVMNNPDDYLWKFGLGMSTFYYGRAEIEQQNIMRAIRYARKGRNILRDLINERPETEDAYYVLGVYEYVAGSVPRGLRWLTYLLDISGDRALGIKYLRRATENAEIMAPEAARLLLAAAAIEPEHNEPCQYISLARDTRRKFPLNPHYSAALQLILVHCGYPEESLAENKRAFRVYLEQFPGMTDSLNLVKLQVYPSMGALDEIEKLAPVFKSKNYEFWYLAKAQTYDVIGERKKAVYMYREIETAVDNPDDSTAFYESPSDFVYEKARIYLRQPYRRTKPVKVNRKTSLSLHIPGKNQPNPPV